MEMLATLNENVYMQRMQTGSMRRPPDQCLLCIHAIYTPWATSPPRASPTSTSTRKHTRDARAHAERDADGDALADVLGHAVAVADGDTARIAAA